jgi:hypothetical protein
MINVNKSEFKMKDINCYLWSAEVKSTFARYAYTIAAS